MKGPSSPWQFSAAMAAQIGLAAQNDPARPFQTLALVGIYAPKEADRFTLEERNTLLFNGIATSFVDAGGNVLLETIITTYKKNAFNSPDISYLYLNTLLTLSYLRFDLKARITSRFPRHKLANDGGRYAPGQAVVTPNSVKAEVISKFREWEEKEYFKHCSTSRFKGDTAIIIILHFMNSKDKLEEFIVELYKYFNMDSSPYNETYAYINYTKFTHIKDI
jgi:phage tail sheath gpL-like